MTNKELLTLIKEHLQEISESHECLTKSALDYFLEEIKSFLENN